VGGGGGERGEGESFRDDVCSIYLRFCLLVHKGGATNLKVGVNALEGGGRGGVNTVKS